MKVQYMSITFWVSFVPVKTTGIQRAQTGGKTLKGLQVRRFECLEAGIRTRRLRAAGSVEMVGAR